MEENELVQKARDIANMDNPDNEQAYQLLLKAHEQGEAEATYAIATWYLHGICMVFIYQKILLRAQFF